MIAKFFGGANVSGAGKGTSTGSYVNRPLLLLAVAAGIFLGIGGYTFLYAEGLSYMSDDPEVAIGAQSSSVDGVQQEIDYYISVGAISPREMESLQANIARLNPADRRLMLSKLTQAMNDGLIDGHF